MDISILYAPCWLAPRFWSPLCRPVPHRAACWRPSAPSATAPTGMVPASKDRWQGLFNDLIDMKYRPIEGIMDRQARGYTDEQLRLISDYLSTLPGNAAIIPGGKQMKP